MRSIVTLMAKKIEAKYISEYNKTKQNPTNNEDQ